MKPSLYRTTCVLTAWMLVWAGCCIPPLTQAGPPPARPLPPAKDVEPNDDLATAISISLDASSRAEFSGNVSSPDDVDVYDIGRVEPGDRIMVEVRIVNGSLLDPVAALFDADLDMINRNDDEDYASGKFDSVIDHTVRHAGDHCYLAITRSGFSPSTGQYSVDIQVTRNGTVPVPEGQTVLLDFDGATVHIPGERTYNIGAFEPGGVDSRLNGRDDEVKESIQDFLEDRFSPYDIDFVTTDEAALPDEGTYSRLAFGGRSTTVFGISQAVDHYNENIADEAIIFTDRWVAPFSLTPALDAVLISLGNVAAHELGHLLGLEHTVDITSLMDSTGRADTILVPQDFKRAPVYEEVFPFGWQDAPQLLLDTLGPIENPP